MNSCECARHCECWDEAAFQNHVGNQREALLLMFKSDADANGRLYTTITDLGYTAERYLPRVTKPPTSNKEAFSAVIETKDTTRKPSTRGFTHKSHGHLNHAHLSTGT